MNQRVRIILCSSLLWCMPFAVQAKDSDPLDEALLEDLGAELLKPSKKQKAATGLDTELLEQLGGDVGTVRPVQDDWLSKVVANMKTAQAMLEQSEDIAHASSAQQQALTGIDAMIAELAERQSQCKGGKSGGKQAGKPKHGKKPSKTGKVGKNPPQDASPSTNSDADLSTDLAVAGDLVKDLWGKLPERQREQILQPLSEEFLPKYASEIEAYFRALADPNRTPVKSR